MKFAEQFWIWNYNGQLTMDNGKLKIDNELSIINYHSKKIPDNEKLSRENFFIFFLKGVLIVFHNDELNL